MGRVRGMDPERVEATAARIDAQLASLLSAAEAVNKAALVSLNPISYAVQPGGLLIAPAAIVGTQVAAARVREATAAARELSHGLLAESIDQRQASSASGLSVDPGRRGVRATLASIGDDPDRVRRWWEALSSAERQRILEDDPAVVANRDGIPFVDRIRAHREDARRRLRNPGLSAAEREYLENVAKGNVQLVLYDPRHDRIIEAIGDLGQPAPSRVITYLPGTDASLDGFYDGSTRQVARYLAKRDPSIVAFVYKDGPWATWTGERSNLSADFAGKRGGELAAFQRLMRQEDGLSTAQQIAIGHSWGLTAVTSSEASGAHYDRVLSLSGAWIPEEWNPGQGTSYHHYQYLVDPLANVERIQSVYRTPQDGTIWEYHGFGEDHWRFSIFGREIAVGNGIDNHSRISRGPADNQSALDAMYLDVMR